MKKHNNRIYNLLLFFVMCLILCCPEAQADVFGTISGRANTFAHGLRKFALGMSCFGIVMFTWAAISGKINFKHLGYIFISLFMVSGVFSLIEYMTSSPSENLDFTLSKEAWRNAANCTSSLGSDECNIDMSAVEEDMLAKH